MEFDAGRCLLHDARVASLEKSVEELTCETIKGNGRQSLKARMDNMETTVTQLLDTFKSHIDMEKHNLERRGDRNWKLLLQTLAILAAIFIAKFIN